MSKKIILFIIISLSGLFVSFLLYWFKTRNLTLPLPSTENTTISTTSTTVITTNPKISNSIVLKGIVKSENNITIQYEILREGIISDPKGMRKIYDVELKATNYKTFSKNDINLVSKELVTKILEVEKDIKEIDISFFSDRSFITNKPFDIAYATWQADTNEIIITLRKDLRL